MDLCHDKCNQGVALMQNSIEKDIELKSPVARVWRALTDHEEFGQWFQVKLDGQRRVDALRSNTQGWTEQVKHIAAHVQS